LFFVFCFLFFCCLVFVYLSISFQCIYWLTIFYIFIIANWRSKIQKQITNLYPKMVNPAFDFDFQLCAQRKFLQFRNSHFSAFFFKWDFNFGAVERKKEYLIFFFSMVLGILRVKNYMGQIWPAHDFYT
jgi:hypothetical protein